MRRKMNMMIRRPRGPRERNCWRECVGSADGRIGMGVEMGVGAGAGAGDVGGKAAGGAWEGGIEVSDDEEVRSRCSKSLILFCASYNSAAFRSSSALSICLLSSSVSSSLFRVSFTLFSRLELSTSSFSRSFSNIARTNSVSASVGAALPTSGVAWRSSSSLRARSSRSEAFSLLASLRRDSCSASYSLRSLISSWSEPMD